MSKLLHAVNSSRRNRALLLSSAAVCVLASSGAAFAQSAKPSEATAVEQIIVTGSSIRGVAPVGSALIGVTKETIALQAPANTKELLSSIPQLGNFGANAEQSTSNRFRTAGFQPNIHNLGIYATLTLVNGHRIAPTGGEAVFPDPSMIPVIAVQRVELIADGASAIYGSDAVAGVVNFIYRKPVDTLEASATYGFNNSRYRKRDFATLWGKTWDGGGLMAAYEYSDNLSPWNTDIGTLALGGDQTSRGGRDLRGNVCLTPTIRSVNAATNPPRATGTTYGPGPTFTTDAVALRCGVLSQQTVIPDGKRHAFLLTANHQLTDTINVWAEVNYSHYATDSLGGRQTLNLVVPRTNPYFAANVPAALAAANSVYLTRSALGLFEGTTNSQYADFAGLTVGADIDLTAEWKGNLMIHASATRDFNNSQELDLINAQKAANGTTTATALNPWAQAAGNNATVLASINNGFIQNNKTSQRLREVQFKADGPLFAIGGGDVRAAFGVNYRGDQAIQLQDAGSRATGASFYNVVRDDNINRSIAALFSEINAPLVSDANALPGVAGLTLSLSGRYDYYDTYGGKFNPKIGVVYSPIKDLDIHASYGTNFAAPNTGLITNIFSVPQTNSNYNLKVATGQFTGETLGTVNVLNIGGGNPDLEPEEAKTFSVGFNYAPNFVEGLRLGATYYNVEYTNLIYKATNVDVITNPAFAAYRIIHPSDAQIADYLRRYPSQQPVTTGYDVIFNSNAINIGARKFAGVDIDASYALRTDSMGVFNFSVNANRQLAYDQQVSDGQPFTSQLGSQLAPEWKSTQRVTWNLDSYTVSLSSNYVGSFANTSITPNQEVKSNNTYDLTASYKLPTFGAFKASSIQVRAANLFDKNPPFYDAAAGYFPALASPFGRTIDVTLRATF